jgi:hypothetical protein
MRTSMIRHRENAKVSPRSFPPPSLSRGPSSEFRAFIFLAFARYYAAARGK